MPKFRFIGNGNDDPQSITINSVTFELHGEPQEGPEKLRTNSHFEEVGGSVNPLFNGNRPQINQPQESGPVMKHRGHGKYDVTLDGELIADNVTKQEAEALINGNEN